MGAEGAANAAKVELQAEARKRLGPRRFDAMFAALVAWTEGEAE